MAINKIPLIINGLMIISQIFHAISISTLQATHFVFGPLGHYHTNGELGFILAIHGLPVLIVVSALSSVLMHWKILPFIIWGFAWFFQGLFRIRGTLGVAVSANIFMGMSETPLFIRSYLNQLTTSELFSLMVVGMAGVSTSVIVLYSIILDPLINNSLLHILTSIFLGLPGALVISRIIVPETQWNELTPTPQIEQEYFDSTLEAIYSGITAGGQVVVKILAMLIGFVALIDLANQGLAYCLPTDMPPLRIRTKINNLF